MTAGTTGTAGTATVAELRYYPVKGCAGISVPRSRVEQTGLAGDRSFVIVDAEGSAMTQRWYPPMAVLEPSFVDDGARMVLRAPDFPEFGFPVVFEGPCAPVSVFTWSGKAVDQGDEVSEWLSTVLGLTCRLLRVPPEHDRDSRGVHAGKVGFADSTPLLVTSLSSLDGLNERILESGGDPVPMNRFRPNIVLRGWERPHTEDEIRVASAGSAEFGYAKDCVRCAVPTVDQATGRKAGPEPIRTLARYRRAPEGGVTFGMKAAVLRPGEIAVGDPVIVREWA